MIQTFPDCYATDHFSPCPAEHDGEAADRAIVWEQPILVGCCPSSGSTLLSVMLDAHPDVSCGPELSIFAHPLVWQGSGDAWRRRLLDCLDLYPARPPREAWNLDHGAVPYQGLVDVDRLPWYGLSLERLKHLIRACDSADDLVRGMFGLALLRRGKRFWAEKSPPNLYALPLFLQQYPAGKAVVMVRDGRDVVCSLLQRGLTLCEASSIWLVEATLSLMLSAEPRVKLIRYEDLVAAPARTLADLTDFLDLPPAGDAQLHYHEHSDRVTSDPSLRVTSWTNAPTAPVSASAVGRWKRDLSAAQREVFYRHRLQPHPRMPGFAVLPTFTTADLLKALDYEPPATGQAVHGDLVDLLVRERPLSRQSRGVRGLHRTGTELVLEPELARQVLAASQAAIDDTTADLQAARQEIATLKAQLSAAQQRIGDAEAARRLTNDRAVAAETALEGIYSSRSWRLLQRLRRWLAFLVKPH